VQGREALKSTKEQAENQLNLDVIYGDTDSIMVNTRIPSVPSPDADPALRDSATGALPPRVTRLLACAT
jgi:hypothetical protein